MTALQEAERLQPKLTRAAKALSLSGSSECRVGRVIETHQFPIINTSI
ncbi:MAG: hypothetical protein FD138_278 [Planctomycetota bacterium]|nr:MAG: hypothetical protein FD138_278 [Planctomycetota bacterium]